MYCFKQLSAAALLVALIPYGLPAQPADSLKNPIPRLSGPVTLDGKIDEDAWRRIDPLPLVMFEPVFRGEMSDRTLIRVAHDGNHLYVAGELYTSDPSDIRVNTLSRDDYSEDDTFALVVDPFNDNENALWFFTNPAGVRVDMAISNDADFSSGRPMNDTWNTHWEVETTRTSEGWFAEMRIPFSSIGLQVRDGRAEIGFITYRYLSRGVRRHIYPAIPPEWGLAFAKPSQARDVVLEGVESRRPLYLSPYLLGGLERQAAYSASSSAWEAHNDFTREAGFDLKYNLSSNLTLDATFNTDFAQVEADDQQVNLTRFPLFFPEKRQFFQERASIFSFSLGGRDQLFFSRRIGLDAEGTPIRIWGGGRLTGRTGEWDLGLLNMQTADSDNLPSENFGVLRLKRRVFNENSYLGAMLTSRLSEAGHNVAYGMDGVLRVTGNDYATLRYAQTFYDGLTAGQRGDPGDTGFLSVDWSNRRNQGFFYSASFARSGRNFDPGVGFVTRRDFTSGSLSANFARLLEQGDGLRRWQAGLSGSSYVRNPDGSLETGSLELSGELAMMSGAELNFSLEGRYEDLRRDVSFLPGTEVPEGAYRFIGGEARFQMAPYRLLRTNLTVSAGSFYDGHRWGFSAEPVWNVSEHLELGGTYSFNALRFPGRGQSYDAHIVRLRTQMAANRRLSGNAFVQYSNVAELVAANLRVRYNFGEGRDLWLVYNEQLNTEREVLDPGVPRRPISRGRALLLKFTYTLGL
ncbi:MAG: DUF5916 domain-containing protein [Balneolaceae bacterium]|nr:DUF5916 domain-containing protein [Balneolaceae bacterium]